MSTVYEIIVENNSNSKQDFYFFQQPAIYSDGEKVYTNSIGNCRLPAKGAGTNQIIFSFEQQYYAGAQKQFARPVLCNAQIEQVLQVPIDLASEDGETNDYTKLILDDDTLNLTDPVFTPGVQTGAFRIYTPPFNPAQHKYNIGLSFLNDDVEILLSNFIKAESNKNTDVQPIVKFYVNTGSYQPGTTVNFTTSSVNAALCDATDGTLKFKVAYNANGTWTVNKII
jgi:hypothetical protein